MRQLVSDVAWLAVLCGAGFSSLRGNALNKPKKSALAKSEIMARIAEQYPVPVSISPDGNWMLLRTAKSDSDELLVVDIHSGRTVVTTESTETQLGISWSPDGSKIAYLTAPGNGEAYRLYVWDLSKRLVTRMNAPVTSVAVQPPRWRPDGVQLAYLVGSFEDSAIWLVDVQQRIAPHLLIDHARPRADFEWSPDGKQMAFVLARSPATLRIISTSKEELVVQIPIGAARTSEVRDLSWAPSGKSLAVTGRILGNYTELRIVDLTSGQTHRCVSMESSVASPRFAPDGQTIVFSLSKNAEQILYSTSCDGSARLLAFDSGTTRFLRFLKYGSAEPIAPTVFGALYTAPNEPPALYEIYLQSGQADPLFRPAHSGQLVSPSPRLVEITSTDLPPIPAVLWESSDPSSSAGTILVDVHGGPHLQSYRRWEFLTSLLSSSGVAVLSPNYIGSSGYGYPYEERGTTNERVKEIVATCKFAKNLGGQPHRVILMGTSYGSFLAAAAAVSDTQDIDGLILISLVLVDSPHSSLHDPNFPIFCFHGDNDPLAPEKARGVVASFLGSNGSVEWRTMGGEGHVFRHAGSWAEIYSALLNLVSVRDKETHRNLPGK